MVAAVKKLHTKTQMDVHKQAKVTAGPKCKSSETFLYFSPLPLCEEVQDKVQDTSLSTQLSSGLSYFL